MLYMTDKTASFSNYL